MVRENKKKMVAAALALLGASAAHAQVAYEASAGFGHSDNISRVDEGAIDETLASIGIDLSWEEKTRRLEGDALVDLSYVEYLEGTYDGEIVGTAEANFDFGILPERFHWVLQDSFGQAQTDPFTPVTPGTRENINYFTTGPDFYLRFGQAMTVQLFGRYSDTRYETSPLDAQRTTLGLAAGRELSARSRAALNFVADDSRFDDDGPSDYKRRSAFLSYDLDGGGRTVIHSRVGYSWLEMDGAEEDGGLLFDVSIARDLTDSSTVELGLSQEFSDAGESLTDVTGGGTSQITASADPFESSEVSLSWSFNRHRTSLGARASYTERTYETQSDFDSERAYYSLNAGRVLRPTLRLNLMATYATEDFVNADTETDDWTVGLTLDWDFGRNLGLRLRAERAGRSSTIPAGDYLENRAFLEFTYRGDRSPSSR